MNTDVQDYFFYNIKRYKGLIYYAVVLKFEAILDQISSCRNSCCIGLSSVGFKQKAMNISNGCTMH